MPLTFYEWQKQKEKGGLQTQAKQPAAATAEPAVSERKADDAGAGGAMSFSQWRLRRQESQPATAQKSAGQRDDAAVRDRFAQLHPEMTGGAEGQRRRTMNSLGVKTAAAKQELEAAEAELKRTNGAWTADPRGASHARADAEADAAKKRVEAARQRLTELDKLAGAETAPTPQTGTGQRDDAAVRDRFAQLHPEMTGGEEGQRSRVLNGLRVRIAEAKQELEKEEAVAYGAWTADPRGASHARLRAESDAAEKRADAARQRLIELSNLEYELRNMDAARRLEGDQAARQVYDEAGAAAEDIDKLLRMSAAVQGGYVYDGYDEDRAYLDEKYGFTDQDYFLGFDRGEMKDSYERANREYEDAAGRLKESGYDREDMEAYTKRKERQATMAEYERDWAEIAKEHPHLATALTFVAAPFQAMDLLSIDAGKGELGDPGYVPPDSSGMGASAFINTTRGTAAQWWAEKFPAELFGQNIAAFLYQTGASVVDSALSVGLLGPNSIYLMGTNAGVNKAKEVIDRGGTSEQAFWGGITAGTAEMLFEKVSVDQLLKPKEIKTWRALVKEILTQGGVEASEEVFTEIANVMSDTAIMGANSDFDRAVEQYQSQGMDEEQAKQKAYLDLLGQVFWAGAGGFLSGVSMGGVKGTADYAQQTRLNNQAEKAAQESRKTQERLAHEAVVLADLPLVDRLGESGRTGLTQILDARKTMSGTTEDMTYSEIVEGFTELYLAGLEGAELEPGGLPLLAGENAERLSPAERMQAYFNGQNDAKAQVEANRLAATQAKAAGQEKGLNYDTVPESVGQETADRIDELARRLNLRVRFVDHIDMGTEGANGQIVDADLLIAKDANMPEMVVLGHEVGHRLEQTAPKEYQTLRRYVGQRRLADIQERMAEYQEAGLTQNYDEILNEFVNDEIGQMIADPEVMDAFISQNRSDRGLLRRVADVLRSLWEKLTGRERQRVQTAREALLAALNASEVQSRRLERAGRVMDVTGEVEAATTRRTGPPQEGARYSYVGKTADGIEVYETSGEVKALPYKERLARFKKIMEEEYAGRTARFDADGEVYYARFGPKDIQKNIYGDKKSSKKGQEAKVNAGADGDIFDLVEHADYFGSGREQGGKKSQAHMGVTGWDYFVKKVQIDGRVYNLLANVRKKPDGEYIYSIQLNEDKTKSASPIAAFAKGEPALRSGEADTDIIDQTERDVKPKFSLAEAEGPREEFSVEGEGEDGQTRYSLKSKPKLQALERENQVLRERLEQAKKQTRRSSAGKVSEEAVGRYIRDTMRDFGIKGDSKAFAMKALAIYDGIASGVDADGAEYTYQDARDMTRALAGDMIRRAVVVDSAMYDDYADLRAYVRGMDLVVDPETRASIADYEAFRRRNMGRVPIRHGDTGNIDQRYTSLSRMWPELFDPEITNQQDQLERIAEVMAQVYAREEINPFQGDLESATEYLAHEILQNFWNMPGEKATYADRQWRARQELKRQHMAEIQNVVQTERARARQQRQDLKDWYKDRDAKARAARAESEERNKLLRVLQRLDRVKVDKPTRDFIKGIFGDIDTVARRLTPGREMDLQDLLADYALRGATDPDFITDPYIEKEIARLSPKLRHIDDLTIEDVRDLTRVALAIENTIRTEKRLVGEQEARDIYQLGEQTIKDIRATKGGKAAGLGKVWDKYFVTETLSPVRMVRRMVGYKADSPLLTLTMALNEGQRKMYAYQMEAQKPFERFANDKNFTRDFSGADAKTVKILGMVGGKSAEVEVTRAMMVSLWLHSQNDANGLHMRDGGVRVPDIRLYRKGKIADAYAAGTVIKVSPSMAKSLWGQMTKTEREFARAVQNYFDKVSKPAINEVSNVLRGYDIAEVENYFPILTDKTFGKADLETLKFDGTIEGMGWLTGRIDHAHNPMVLEDVNSVLERSIRMHGKYVGLAIPVRNFGKVWNISTAAKVDAEDGGTPTWSSYGDSVQNAIQTTWGKAGYDYMAKLMTDIQTGGNAAQASWAKTLAKVRSNYAGAVLGLNLSVAMKQAASYPTAAAVLGWRPLIRAMGDVGRVDLGLIAKYTPLQWLRSQGYSTKELGDIQQYGGVMKEVFNKKALNWIQGVDLLTTRKLWKASEYYVQENSPKLAVGSDAYYRAVAEIYNRVIEETQPDYTTMQRPQLLRSDDSLLGNLAMFKTQPFQNFNILYDAAGEYRATVERAKTGDATSQEVKAARKNLNRAVTSQVAQLGVFAGMTMLWALFRGKKDKYEKDGKMDLWSVLGGLGKDTLSGIASTVPWGSEAWEFFSSKIFGDEYYGMEPVATEAISNTVTSLSKLWDTILGTAQSAANGEEIDWRSGLYQLDDSWDDVSKLLGVPHENVMNLFNGFARWACIGAQGKYMGEYVALHLTTNATKNQAPYMDLLYKAMEEDRGEFDKLYAQMIQDGFASGKIKSAMESRMKKSEGVTKVSELKYPFVNPTEREDFDRAMEMLQDSVLWGQATEAQRDKAEGIAYDLVSSKSKQTQATLEKLKQAGIDKGTYALYKLAIEMADRPTESGKMGTYTNSEKEEAIRSMSGLTEKERAALWELAGGSEKNNPWK